MTDPKAAIHNALRLARAVGGGAQGPSYYDQLLGKVGADADSDLTPTGRPTGMGQINAPMDREEQKIPENFIPSMGEGDGSLGGLGDTAPGGGYGGSPGGFAGGSPAGDGGGPMGGAMARGGSVDDLEYPLDHQSNWYGDANYEQTGGKLVTMKPEEFLSQVRPMKIDDVARDNIDDLKNHISSGGKLDPLAIYPNGKEDGRHRAHAARELGIEKVPVLVWPKNKEEMAHGGKVDKGFKLLQDQYPTKYMPHVGRQVMQDGGVSAEMQRQTLKDMVSSILSGMKKPQGRQSFASGGDAKPEELPDPYEATQNALRIAQQERDRQALDQPVVDPMGGMAMPPAQNTAQPGIYDRAMDVIGRIGGAVGEPVRAGLERYGQETYEAAQDAAKLARESGAKSVEQLKTGQYPAALSSLGWQAIGALGIPFAPVTGAAKIMGEEATKVSGDPVFGSKVQFGAEFLDPSHSRSVLAAVDKARDLMQAAQPDDLAKLAIFAGPKSADPVAQEARQRAIAMRQSEGAFPGEVWRETMWGERPNKQEFYEIPDQGSVYNPNEYIDWASKHFEMTPKQIINTGTVAPPLEAVFKHDELYRAYPQLKELPVVLENQQQHERMMQTLGSDYGGYYDPAAKSIVLSPSVALDPEKGRSVILHEIQHWVQEHEGAPLGTNIATAAEARRVATMITGQAAQTIDQIANANLERARYVLQEMENFGADYRPSERMAPIIEEAIRQKAKNPNLTDEGALAKAMSEADPDFQAAMKNMREYQSMAYATPYEIYQRKAGEVEARNVQGRMDFPTEERRERAPWMTQDTFYDQQFETIPGRFGFGSQGPVASAAPQVERQLTPLGLYSVGREAALTLKQEKGAPQQMTAMLKSAGVKPAELENAGIIDAQGNLTPEWANRKTVTREELAEAIQKGNPEVQETVFGGLEKANFKPYEITDYFDELPEGAERIWEVGDSNNPKEYYTIHETTDGDYDVYNSNGGHEFTGSDFEDAVNGINEEINNIREYSADANVAKFEEYTLPGGSNYREVVLHTPEKTPSFDYEELTYLPKDEYAVIFEPTRPEGSQYGVIDLKNDYARKNGYVSYGWHPSRERATGAALQEINAERLERANQANARLINFNESHHDVPNALAHLRMKDREIVPPESSIEAIEEKIRNANLVPTSNPKEWGSGIPELAFARDVITAEEAATYSRHRGFKNMLSDRPGVEQKVLHIDEIQSDWAQKGRDEGFGENPELVAKLKIEKDKLKESQKELKEARVAAVDLYRDKLAEELQKLARDNPNMSELEKAVDEVSLTGWQYKNDDELRDRFNTLARVYRSMSPEFKSVFAPYMDRVDHLYSVNYAQETRVSRLENKVNTPIPEGPYVKKTEQWVDLALKRALNEAAKGNYNKIAFTQGIDQADRYGLHKQLRKIHFLPEGDGMWNVGAELPSGQEFDRASGLMDEKQIAEMFGKDIADKVKAGEFSGTENNVPYIEGDDLRAGGKGMLKFYDEIVPKRTRELLKKLDKDAQVKTEFIATSGEPWPFTINIAHDGDKYWLTSMDPRQSDARKHTISPKYNSYEEADKIRQGFMEGRTTPVYTVEMTPKLKEAIGKGLPAYKRGGSVVDKALMLTSKYA